MIAADILAVARARGIRIATAESCTGGMIAAALTDIAGSSDLFDRGYVTYSNDAKIAMLGVQQTTLTAHGAVSEQIAAEMAAGAITSAYTTLAHATLAVATTGIAGPGGSDFKPEGRVCFGLAQIGHPTQTCTIEFGPLGRAAVRAAATEYALGLLSHALDPA